MATERRRNGFSPPHRTPQELAAALRELASEAGEPRLRPRRPAKPRRTPERHEAARQAVPAPSAAGAAPTPATPLAQSPTSAAAGADAVDAVEEPPLVAPEPVVDLSAVVDQPAAFAPERRANPSVDRIWRRRSAPEPAAAVPAQPGSRGRGPPAVRLAIAGSAAVIVLIAAAALLGNGPGRPAALKTISPASTTISAPAAPTPARHRHHAQRPAHRTGGGHKARNTHKAGAAHRAGTARKAHRATTAHRRRRTQRASNHRTSKR